MANLLFVLDSKEYGGAEVYTITMIELLSKSNSVTVVTRKSHFSEIISQKERILLIEKDFDNMPLVRFAIEKIVMQFDICFFIRWRAIAIGAMVRKKIRFRMVSMIMTVFEPGTRVDGNNNLARDMELISILNNCSDKILVTAQCAKESIVKYGAKDELIFILNDATKDIMHKYGEESQEIKCGMNIAYCGRLSYEKGPDILLRSFSYLLDRLKTNKNVTLHILGKGVLESTLKDYVKNSKMESYVKFHDFVDEPGMIIRSMDFVVVPSRHDAIPLSAIEAMCLGKPLIVSNVGGLPECVADGENGYLFNNEYELIDILEKMFLLDHRKMKDMGKASRKMWLEKFSIKNFESKMELLCNEVLDVECNV